MPPRTDSSRGRKRAHDGAGPDPASAEADRAAAKELIESPRGLSLLLEVRALLGTMAKKRARIGARLRQVKACTGAIAVVAVRLPAESDANVPWGSGDAPPQQSPPPSLIDDLPAELLALVAHALPLDDKRVASLSCRKLRVAVALEWQRDGRAKSTTGVHSALTSLRKLQWAVSCGLPQQATLCAKLAYKGLLVDLAWLRVQGCPWDASTCGKAAFRGHMALLQWARANGCPWASDTCSSAAGGGHLAVLQWARANECSWDADTCVQAARGGHLAVLQWARANGCDWDGDTVQAAAENGHDDVVQWALANGCPDYDDEDDYYGDDFDDCYEPDLEMLGLCELGDLADETGLSDQGSREELINRFLDELDEVYEGNANFED